MNCHAFLDVFGGVIHRKNYNISECDVLIAVSNRMRSKVPLSTSTEVG